MDINRARALDEVFAAMEDLYSFVETSDNLTDTISSLNQDILIRISRQMTECGIFIQLCASNIDGG
jgi:hypothetical protein